MEAHPLALPLRRSRVLRVALADADEVVLGMGDVSVNLLGWDYWATSDAVFDIVRSGFGVYGLVDYADGQIVKVSLGNVEESVAVRAGDTVTFQWPNHPVLTCVPPA